jgi:hypothetical protein
MEPDNLVKDLVLEEADLYQAGRKNHLTDLVCSYGAIIASFLATILVALGNVPPFVTAVIAAVPALCTSFQKITDFRGRATWYFLKAVHMQDLLLNVKYGNISTQEGAKRWGEMEKAFEERWPKLVRGGAPSPEGEQPSGAVSG